MKIGIFMKRIVLILISFFIILGVYGQSPGLSVYTGLTAMRSGDRVVTAKGELHYGWLVGADGRLVEGDLYFLMGGQYIKTSLHSSKSMDFFKKRDFNIVSGRFGLGFNIARLSEKVVLRSKVIGSVNFIVKAPEDGLHIDGYRELNTSYMGIASGIGFTLGIMDIDLEYQYGIFNAFYQSPDTKFNGITLTGGVYF
jgi:hypothetical protein